jgi:hypothetical protein
MLSRQNIQNLPEIMSLFLAGAYRLIPAVSRLSVLFQNLSKNKYLIKTFLDELDISHADEKIVTKNQKSIYNFNRKIELKNISFSFKKDEKKIINNISLLIKKDEKVGIIGKSGRGKTTLLNIILGFLKPNEGNFTIDDNEDAIKDLEGWLTCVSYVPQNPVILNDSIKTNVTLEHENINFDSDDICSIISSNEISAKEILSHQIYIQENIAKSYIQLYSLLGSYYWNFYIRNKCFKDLFVEKQIDNLYSIISKAPEFEKDYWLYRFISDDNYLSHLIPGDTFEETSFISTTRNPFYDPKNNLFGFILIKIKIPKGKEGIGLCIESYSMFQGEEEILLNPAILKLVSIKDNCHY